ncbi:MAG: SidA/IucD/PvdA family monooxygenase [Nonomuraea muscovyensis]|nr:SidA/IucD/PvdA family monooxygenase [Nonomuraea muscovyensis]
MVPGGRSRRVNRLSGGKTAGGAVVGTDVEEIDVVVIGAGQAGLSSAYFLRRFGLETVVLDAADGPGGAWRHRSPTLTMDKVHGIFDLPGGRREPGADGRRPAAEAVPAYYAAYERELGLGVLRPVTVSAVTPGPHDRLLVTAAPVNVDAPDRPYAQAGTDVPDRPYARREWAARAVVNATGTWTRPYWPYYPGARDFLGRQLHYAAYRGPEAFAGRRVVVVGGGHSAAHVLSELAGVAAGTLWVTRRPPDLREDDFGEDARREAVARVEARVRAGLPPQSVVGVTGLGHTPVVREALEKGALDRLPMFTRITPYGVAWADGHEEPADTIIWATGFRSALDHLAPLHLRRPGGGIAVDGTRALADPRVQLVGYGPSASTVGANRAGRTAARNVHRLLTSSAPLTTPAA